MSDPAVDGNMPVGYTGIDNLEVMREAENYNRYLQSLVERHAVRARRIIDFGAGSGTFAIPCATAGLDVTAVEPDERLREILYKAGLSAVADVASLPDATFDYAYTLNVLEHIDDDVEALRILRDKLVPGARLLVYVPAFPVLFTSMDVKVGHVRRYTRRTLSASLRAAGFELETIRYADSLGFAATLLFKLIDGGKGDVNRRLLRLYDRLAFPVSRALDVLTHRWLGKNLLALATKPAA
jgi:SAM-dependent methyltransferase